MEVYVHALILTPSDWLFKSIPFKSLREFGVFLINMLIRSVEYDLKGLGIDTLSMHLINPDRNKFLSSLVPP